MDAIHALHTKTLSAQPEGEQDRKKALETAQQFEQMLVRQLVSSLRSTSKMGGEEGGMFGSEPGADTYTDWFDEHVAKDVSEHGRIGVADALMEEFDRVKRGRKTLGDKALDEVDVTKLAAPRMPVRLEGGIDATR